jgi:hypothetical protein
VHAKRALGQAVAGRYKSWHIRRRVSERSQESTEMVAINLVWTPTLCRSIEDQAKRLGQTPGWVVEQAWELAGGELADENDSTTIEQGGPRRLAIELPREIFAAVEAKAEGEKCSVAWILQRTVTCAWSKIEALPSA